MKEYSFSSDLESLQLVLLPLTNLYYSFLGLGWKSPNHFASAENTAWAAARSALCGYLVHIQVMQLER